MAGNSRTSMGKDDVPISSFPTAPRVNLELSLPIQAPGGLDTGASDPSSKRKREIATAEGSQPQGSKPTPASANSPEIATAEGSQPQGSTPTPASANSREIATAEGSRPQGSTPTPASANSREIATAEGSQPQGSTPTPATANSTNTTWQRAQNRRTSRTSTASTVNLDLSLKPPVAVEPVPEQVGISFSKNNKKWGAYVRMSGLRVPGHHKSGMQIFLGQFSSAFEAQIAHDKAAFQLYNTHGGITPALNFPRSAWHAEYLEERKRWTFRDCVWEIRRFSESFTNGMSSFKGVILRPTAAKRYRARIAKGSGEGRIVCDMGPFEREEDAGRAYDLVLLFLNRDKSEELLHVITNFRPSEYSDHQIMRAGQQYKIV